MCGITQFVEIIYRNTQIRFKYSEKIGYLIKMSVRFGSRPTSDGHANKTPYIGGAELYKVCSALNTLFLLHQITGGVRSQNIPENLRPDLRGSTNH